MRKIWRDLDNEPHPAAKAVVGADSFIERHPFIVWTVFVLLSLAACILLS
jgi:hypothetical protein